MIYCIDSNIIIWGIKKQASPGQEDMIPRAERLFKRFDEYQDQIVIPTVVLAEVLAAEPQTIRVKYLETLSKSFIIAQFDERAALKYAEILHGRFEDLRDISKSNGISRQKMKADHIVIATAIVNNASCIYSTDPGMRVFAKDLISVMDLPPIVESTPMKQGSQTELFGNLPTEIAYGKKQQEEGTDEKEPF